MSLSRLNQAVPVAMDEDDSRYDYEELLIDGDLLVFSSCAAVEYNKSPEDYTLAEILTNIEGRILAMKRRLRARNIRIFFTDEDNFRYQIHSGYKAHRKDAWIPPSLSAAKSHVMVMFHGEKVAGLEADDLLAANQKQDGTTIIATIDKDIPQVRGMHYRWETPHAGEKVFEVDGMGTLEKVVNPKNNKTAIKGNGIRFFCYQLLIGDPTDGVMGCGKLVDKIYKTGAKAGQAYTQRVGVGPVEAFELLQYAITYPRCMGIVIQQYQKCFGDSWKEELLKNGRCLFMVNKIREDGKFQIWHYEGAEFENSWYDPVQKAVVSVKMEG